MYWATEIALHLSLLWVVIWIFARDKVPGFWTTPWWVFFIAVGEIAGAYASILFFGYEAGSYRLGLVATLGGALGLYVVCFREYKNPIALKISGAYFVFLLVGNYALKYLITD